MLKLKPRESEKGQLLVSLSATPPMLGPSDPRSHSRPEKSLSLRVSDYLQDGSGSHRRVEQEGEPARSALQGSILWSAADPGLTRKEDVAIKEAINCEVSSRIQ
jgi:hypothetical protein